jgi:cytochrome c oxidase subunit 2
MLVGAAAAASSRGPAAERIDELWWLLLALGTAVFVLVLVLVIAPIVRQWRARRQPPPDEHGEVPAAMASRWIVGFGVLLPTVLLSVTLAASVTTMRALPRTGDGLVIDVVGRQFWWAATYRDEQVTVANEIHIPVGEKVELRLTSADVIHSFWVPELTGKLDLLPDGVNTLVIEADEAGVYGGTCAEFCGLQHANMRFLVVAQPAREFEAWLSTQRAPAAEPATEAAGQGRDVFQQHGCTGCHTVTEAAGPLGAQTEGAGPDLTHLASRRTLAAGAVDNTTADLAAFVADPDDVKEGTLMPTAELTDDELGDLIAYLEGLT